MVIVTGFILLVKICLAFGVPNIYLEDRFDDGAEWKNRWVQSKHKSDYGVVNISHGSFYGDAQAGVGLQTTQDSRFYAVSRKFDNPLGNISKALVIQFSVKHEQKIDCGGAYIKLLSAKVNQTDFHSDSPYYIMFGPDICADAKVLRIIFNYNGTYFTWNQKVSCKAGRLTHVYTLIIHHNLTYDVLIDLRVAKSGLLLEDFEFSDPISKPNAKTGKLSSSEGMPPSSNLNPEAPTQGDTLDKNFEDHDVSKSSAKSCGNKNDGEKKEEKHTCSADSQEPTTKAYKLQFMDLNFYKGIGALGIDVWQVKSGTIFDNILVTDDKEYAVRFAKLTWQLYKYPEKHMKEKLDEEKEIEEDRQIAMKWNISFNDKGKETKDKNEYYATNRNNEL
uniref:Calreticulin n=1 Tax=Trichuris muris TaxID=70415 RepID=A0A5S6QV96_TRIMR